MSNDSNSWAMPQAFWKKYQWQCKQEQNIDTNECSLLCYCYLVFCVAQVLKNLKL